MKTLGQRVVHAPTGVEGIVTARCEYLYGVPRVRIEFKDSQGHASEVWDDEAAFNPIP